jgi:hypothetical protein
MAGTIVADDLQHSTAGSVGTEYVVNGSAKNWINLKGTSTISSRASLNTSSISDIGTGTYQVNMSSSMSDNAYIFTGVSQNYSDTTARGHGGWHPYPYTTLTTSAYVTKTIYGNYNAGDATTYDTERMFSVVHGDLA